MQHLDLIFYEKIECNAAKENRLKFLNEVINVGANFLGLLLVDKVSCSFHYNNFQIWDYFLEPTTVYIFLDTRYVIG